jgi:hypothetical protein
MKPRGLFSLAALVALTAVAAYSQEVRASITGIVTDASGAPVAGAAVVVTNLAQNISFTTESNETGNYVTPFLAPGQYRLTAERQGFKKFVRENIVLQAQDRARIDIRFEVGDLAQSVTVSDTLTSLQTETATRSQIISNELISQVPTQGRNPFQLAWAAPGVIKTGDWRYLRPFDIAGTSNFSINGGPNRENEVLLDGISNVRGNRTVIHVPSMEAVQEFKVLTNTYDAQYGRTGGGIVSIVTKGGGNQFHGTVYEYFQAEELNANQSELNRAGIPKPPNNINTFGFSASGPFYVPKALDGRNRLFWLLSYEGMRQRSADPGVARFPTQEWRRGDFSTLFNAQGAQVVIFDPLTTGADGSRQPFAANRIPSARIHPVASKVLEFYPLPNTPGEGPARVNNYVFPSRWVADMDEWIGRLDLNINATNNFYFRYGQNPFSEFRGLVWGGSNAAEPTGNAPLIRNGRNWTFDWISILSPRMTFNLRAGLARWEETTGNSFGAGFDPRQLGFAPELVAQFSRLQFPNFSLGSYQSIGSSRLLAVATNDAYTVQPNANLVVRSHYFKFGAEGRRYNDNTNNPGMAAGSYTFLRNWTQQRALQADATSGDEIATFLLGYPSSGFVDRNIDPAFSNFYWVLYFNDDWKVNSRLTISYGLRWDYEAPRFERYDRMVRGLDFNAPSPIASQAQGLDLRGAVLFANVAGQPRGSFERDRNNFQPRAGAAYRVGQKWVLRGGYGLFYLGQNEGGSLQGFSRRTNAIVSTDGNLTPAVNLTNPFANLPGGRLLDPIGSSLGAASFLGEGLAVNFLDRPLPYSHQYSFDIQHELPFQMVVEAGYVGNTLRKLPVSAALNVLPAEVLGRRTAAGAIDTAWYNERIPNPMQGLIPNNAAKNGATIPRQDLLIPFPQFGGITLSNIPVGRQQFHGFQLKLNKRFSHGATFLAAYNVGKNLGEVNFRNPQDFRLSSPEAGRLEKLPVDQVDIPQKFVIAGVWEFPFGKGKLVGGNWNRALDMILGGWQANWNITYQSGWAVDYPNANQVRPGSAKLPSSERSMSRWFDTTLWETAAGQRVPRQEPFTLRDFPSRFSDVRVPGYRNWDASVSKYFPITEQVRLQFRFEMVNAFNTPWFSRMQGQALDVASPTFGQLDPVQRNLPRFLKLAMHLYW